MEITPHREDSHLLVIEAPCAPSQKLKEDGKEAFHYVRLSFELDSEGTCKQVLGHPFSTCGCPVGCIWDVHKGALLCLCHAIITYVNIKVEDEIESRGFVVRVDYRWRS